MNIKLNFFFFLLNELCKIFDTEVEIVRSIKRVIVNLFFKKLTILINNSCMHFSYFL